jgi:methionyl-tRNA formyltransferase
MKVVVFAYHNVGYSCLETLIRNKEEVAAVFTHRDEPEENIFFRSVSELAQKHRIPTYLAENLKEGRWVSLIKQIAPDIIFSFYYRLIIPKEILEMPRLGAMNMHGSLLPEYRGRCPVNWVIVNGETETGVTLHYMTQKPDAGDIVAQKRCEIELEDTAFTLLGKIEKAAVQLLEETLPFIREGRNKRIKQDLSKGSYFSGRKPQDGIIRWNKKGMEIYNLIRAVTHPYPGAFTFWRGNKVFIWKASIPSESLTEQTLPGRAVVRDNNLYVETHDGLLRVVRIQLDGEEEMSDSEFIKSMGIKTGDLFGYGAGK